MHDLSWWLERRDSRLVLNQSGLQVELEGMITARELHLLVELRHGSLLGFQVMPFSGRLEGDLPDVLQAHVLLLLLLVLLGQGY